MQQPQAKPQNDQDQLLMQIAQEHLSVTTLETRRSDRLDFYDVSVWSIKSALQAAFQAGQQRAVHPSNPHQPR